MTRSQFDRYIQYAHQRLHNRAIRDDSRIAKDEFGRDALIASSSTRLPVGLWYFEGEVIFVPSVGPDIENTTDAIRAFEEAIQLPITKEMGLSLLVP